MNPAHELVIAVDGGQSSTLALVATTGGAEMAYDIAQLLFPRTRLQSCYDSVTALAGASLTQPGVVVIVGIGAVAYGRLADGREAKAVHAAIYGGQISRPQIASLTVPVVAAAQAFIRFQAL